MKELRWGALFCGLVVAFTGWYPSVPADAGLPAAPVPTEIRVNDRAETFAGVTGSGTGQQTYIVRFRDGSSTSARTAARRLFGNRVARDLKVFPGMIVRLSQAERAKLASDPTVAYVQPDTVVRTTGTQSDAPWGLDRIDQAGLPLDGRYTVNRSGAKVSAYIIDTGIDASNRDLRGRVRPGATWIDDGQGSADCHGHGTQVAGILGGRSFGVAKGVTLIPLRVLGCDGSGSSAAVVAAMDWVAQQHRRGTPAVVNLSLTGSADQAENEAVKRLVAAGVTVVTAAGNDNRDACEYSPASAPEALTVAASDREDRKAGTSNHGRCVDLYAPGVDIPSAASGPSGFWTASGTSMASPHVAGVAALVLSEHPRWSPAKVTARVLRLSLTDQISQNPAGTPNRLLNIAPTVTSATVDSKRPSRGQTVTITGRGFLSVTKVLFDRARGTRVKVASDTRLTVRVPTHRRSGDVRVQVITALSASNRDVKLSQPAKPIITSVTPASGSRKGGTRVTIHGTGFTGVVAVYFGKRRAKVLSVQPDRLQVRAPAHRAGKVHIRVRTEVGWSKTIRAGRFDYLRHASR